MNPADCHLCGQIDGDPRRDLIAQLLPDAPYVRRVAMESESFVVVPSLGPLADGHVLLCPRTHLRSFADIPVAARAEYDALRRQLVGRLTETYAGAIHIFEHGMACSGGRAVCTVDHAHMHFVPLPERLPAVPLRDGDWREFDGSLATLADLTAGREYVLYEPPGGSPLVAVDPAGHFESQYMRRLIAQALGAAEWNWRSVPDASSAHRTWVLCSSAMAAVL